ncbi:CS1 type fimbrial major subunit [Pseudomonas sp. B22129]|uniref:CS1 type fimbrial major subunit n=1 Tax=Pseudomonas sp. B22129 TaxID=3235111 RepID=UPI00378434C7
MIKRLMMAAPVAALVLGSSFAMAAETITVQLRADVPANDFYVRPVAGTDLSRVQTMIWNIASNRLDALRVDLDMRSTTRGINAKLDLVPELVGGSNRIPLVVKVGTTTLTTASGLVAAAATVANGARNTLSIEPTANATFAPGSYTGTVSVIFEPAA